MVRAHPICGSSVLHPEWSKVSDPSAEKALGQFPIQLPWLSVCGFATLRSIAVNFGE